MTVILKNMPAGVPGAVTRASETTLEPIQLAADTPYGKPLAYDANGKSVATTAAANVTGFLARPFPTTGVGANGDSASADIIQDQVKRGYCSIRLPTAEASKAVRGLPVKLIAAAAGGFAAGDYSISAGVAIPGAFFMGPQDASGNVEISYNI